MKTKLISFPKPAENKIAGIKALRGAFKLPLKEAKELIEDLQEGHITILDCVDSDHLTDFKRAGGEVGDMVTIIEDHLVLASMAALEAKQYETASDIVNILQRI